MGQEAGTTDYLDILNQPVSELQLNQLVVEWVPRDKVIPNSWNPNSMSAGDRALLKQSLLEDGWTQPIVTLPPNHLGQRQIVDGEQRWTTAGIPVFPDEIRELIARMRSRAAAGHPESESILFRLNESLRRLEAAIEAGIDPTIAAITGGLVPVTTLDLGDDAHKIISTIRHNRARGSHGIDAMAGLTQDLVQLGLQWDDLEDRLGMEDDEIRRLLNTANEAETLLKDIGTDFSQAWTPAHISDARTPELERELRRSADAARADKEYQIEKARRNQLIEELLASKVQEREQESGKKLTQDDREKLRAQLAAGIPSPDAPELPVVRKIVFYVTVEQYQLIKQAWGDGLVDGVLAAAAAAAGVA